MQLCGSFILFTQLFVLATTEEQSLKDGLTLYLESTMKEFPLYLKSKLGDPILLPKTVEIYEHNGFLEINADIRNVALNGYMEQKATVDADFVRKIAGVNIEFLNNQEIVGNYSLRGKVSTTPILGYGDFIMSDFLHLEFHLNGFGITDDGRIDHRTARVKKHSRIIEGLLPEFEGLQSAGYSNHIGRLIRSYVAEPFKELLLNSLETYIRTALENASLSKILRDDYDGNLNNSFIDKDDEKNPAKRSFHTTENGDAGPAYETSNEK